MHPTARRREYLTGLLIFFLGLLWFWVFRSNHFTGGDSEQYAREIEGGLWFRKRQMLSIASVRLTYVLMSALMGWTPEMAFNLVSSVAGAISLVILWQMFRRLPDSPWPFVIAATAGFTTVFHGHIETYAQPVAWLLLHLLAIQRSTEDRWPVWPIAGSFVGMMFFHLVALFALPAVSLILVMEARRRGPRPGDRARLICSIIFGVVFWLFIDQTGFGHGEMVGDATVHPIRNLLANPLLLLDQDFFPEKAWFAVVNCGVALPFVPVVFIRFIRERFTRYALFLFICLIGFTLVWSPFAREKDFDLFCFPWVVGVAVVGRHIMRFPLRSVWVGLILWGNLHLWLTRPALFSDYGRHAHGTVFFDDGNESRVIRALIDDRNPLRKENRYVPAGGHTLVVFVAGSPALRRVIRVLPGETYRFVLSDHDLHWVRKMGDD